MLQLRGVYQKLHSSTTVKSQIKATRSLPSRSAPGYLVAAQLSLVGSMVQIASEGDGETNSIGRLCKTGERAAVEDAGQAEQEARPLAATPSA